MAQKFAPALHPNDPPSALSLPTGRPLKAADTFDALTLTQGEKTQARHRLVEFARGEPPEYLGAGLETPRKIPDIHLFPLLFE